MVIDVNQTYCDDHFAIYTNIESLCRIPETNILLYGDYTSIKMYILITNRDSLYFTFSIESFPNTTHYIYIYI